MTERGPISCTWDGKAFTPVDPYWVRRAAKEYVEGEIIRMVEQPERSQSSHAHFFASIQEAWRNLPPLMAERFPSPDHLRRYALIKAGYCNSHSMPCASAIEARRLAAFIRPMDEFSVVTVEKSLVTMYTAKSQSYRTMDKAEFQKSKDEVLRVIAEMLEVSKHELAEAGKAA